MNKPILLPLLVEYYFYHLNDNDVRRKVYDIVEDIENKMQTTDTLDYDYTKVIPKEWQDRYIIFDYDKDPCFFAFSFVREMVNQIMIYNKEYKCTISIPDKVNILHIEKRKG